MQLNFDNVSQDKNNKHIFHLYVIRHKQRDKLKEFLKIREIDAGIHYEKPIHLQEAYANLGYGLGNFPKSEEFSKDILSLPVYPELTDSEASIVAEKVREFFRRE